MAIVIDPATRLISVDQVELTLVSGTLYSLDSDQFRKDVFTLLSSENFIWMVDAYRHNTEVTVAGTTYARTLEFINNYSIQFEDTGSQYSVRIEGSNNNIFDVENGVLVPTSLVTVIPTNSAGLIRADTTITQGDLDAIADAVHDEDLSGHTTAGSAGRALSDVDTLTQTMDGKLDTIDGVVDGIDTQLDTVESKIDTIDTVVDGIDTQLDTVEGKIDTIDTEVGNLPTAADNADAVWDEPTADHQGAGTFGRWVQKVLLTVSKFLSLKDG